MYLFPDPALVEERLQRRRRAAERHRKARPLRAQAAARRAERTLAIRRLVGFRLVEVGLRLLAPPHRVQLPSSRRGS